MLERRVVQVVLLSGLIVALKQFVDQSAVALVRRRQELIEHGVAGVEPANNFLLKLKKVGESCVVRSHLPVKLLNARHFPRLSELVPTLQVIYLDLAKFLVGLRLDRVGCGQLL